VPPAKKKIPKALKRIAEAAALHPGANQAQLANVVGCTPANIQHLFKRYRAEAEEIGLYGENKAKLYDMVNLEILSSITPEVIERANLYQRAGASRFYDDMAVRARGEAMHTIDVRSLQLTVTTSTRELEILQAARAARARRGEKA
jgi:hypothetical protein